jgi:hypothetical protein
MHEKFAKYVDTLEESFERLVHMKPVKIRDLRQPPEKCVYLFSESGRHRYVGRTDHFRQRIRNHSVDSADYNQAPFAFKRAQIAFSHLKSSRGEKSEDIASATEPITRKEQAANPIFQQFFQRAKADLREMDLRYVEENRPASPGAVRNLRCSSAEHAVQRFYYFLGTSHFSPCPAPARPALRAERHAAASRMRVELAVKLSARRALTRLRVRRAERGAISSCLISSTCRRSC